MFLYNQSFYINFKLLSNRTLSYYVKNKKQIKIFDFMSRISKNVYNIGIFCFDVFDRFKNTIYANIYQHLIKMFKFNDNHHKETDIIKFIDSAFEEYYDIYYNLYSDNYTIYKNNNSLIYHFIFKYINNMNPNNKQSKRIVINNKNFFKIYNRIYNLIIKNLNNIKHPKNNKIVIQFDEKNKFLVFDDIIMNILKSFYNKNYYAIKRCIKEKKPFDKNIKKNYKKFIKNKKLNYLFDEKDYLTKIKNKYKINPTCFQTMFFRLVRERLGEINKEFLPYNILNDLISKIYEAAQSYYSLKYKGLKPNVPKYLKKNERYVIPFGQNSLGKKETKKIRLTVGNYIKKNYKTIISNINKDLKEIDQKYYYENEIIKNVPKGEKKRDYLKTESGYIAKNKLFDPIHIFLRKPKKLRNKKICRIEIVSEDENLFKVCITYKIEIKEENKIISDPKVSEYKKINNSISIDLGIKNLFTIYDPTGYQYIVRGGLIISMNEYYNRKISWFQSKLDREKIKRHRSNRIMYLTEKIKRLYRERERKLNGLINEIIDQLVKNYEKKIIFVVGYNEGWKNEINLGTKTNRKFVSIPFRKILKRLNDKLTKQGKKLIEIEESYTSKCDALSFEVLTKKDKYLGRRVKRGLFKSATKKLINADLNGAMNIMRKQYKKMNKITGKNIMNPIILKIKNNRS